ncbi:4-hydroxythreonine-4-phosphate dehydrogenase PdxA [Halomonas sp. 18H]|uniref:4-hydroxythreonine-4-phosphate dehydrogenase PdxA n=1 Tax=Halomonas almeriensis TaxID=308163 RepID=UPI00222E5F42|nr:MULTISPECIES: 4-hydroxythreonine-4-phosphate dehydrogenase PdxA [Halomonas]MCW4149440.1 4-hydroxythreonine-4-phosphate dehydrogenase PdxA [Halomonas sp. 18H]MDN3553614.1 4-hydroxythreonine-4-phosphate dehydrogenase PdxA [Halomonas almeriensis]
MKADAECPVIALTTGEPAGIGPELILMMACQAPLSARLVAVGDPALLAERALDLGLELRVLPLSAGEPPPSPEAGVLPVWPVTLRAPVTPGRLDQRNAAYVLATLDLAVEACQAGRAQAMVTAPLHKGVIIDAGHLGFRGHTEYLRDTCGVDEVVMMLATDSALHTRQADEPAAQALRVALATTHLPLCEVAGAVTAPRLTRILRILDGELRQRFGLVSPRILVCGLNPHAGEEGHLGHEERDIIEPALEALRGEGLRLEGPLPADTLFTPKHLEKADAVLAMYHDQGLPVLKYAGFGRAANITLGLPLVRTSVDHGTALDLAGRGEADPGSLRTAVALAIQMVQGGASSPQ